MKTKKIGKIWLVVLVLMGISCRNHMPTLSHSRPKAVGMSAVHLSRLDEIISQAIENEEFPGADLLVARRGKIVYRRTYGESQWIPEKRTMEPSMIFDLASITKPVATATSILILVERGQIRLWDKVNEYLPDFSPFVDEEENPGEDARLWHLLTHTSGLPPYCEAQEVEDKYGAPCPTELLVEHIGQLEKLCPPGEEFHYSCLGFITLAQIVHIVTGESIADFSQKNIFEPLGMSHTFYNPPASLRENLVPTEVVDGEPLVGVVHDPLARLQGGISGNAGLFSTADDLAVFAQMLLNEGIYGRVRILGPLAAKRMTSIYSSVYFSGRGLGWDLNSAYSTNGGDLFGPKSFGHTGYTGTSIWIDPDTQTFVILLTNRVHPEDGGAVGAIRSKVANVVASAIR